MNNKVLRKIQKLSQPTPGNSYLINRNPRNLEFLRIAVKPSGYGLDKPGKQFWHKINLISSGKYVTAQLVHFENGPVVEASTSEWAIKKQLYKTADTSAYVNLARIFAQRCLQSGFIEMRSDLNATKGGKLEKFLNELKGNGLSLTEPPRVEPQSKLVNRFVGRKEKPYGNWTE